MIQQVSQTQNVKVIVHSHNHRRAATSGTKQPTRQNPIYVPIPQPQQTYGFPNLSLSFNNKDGVVGENMGFPTDIEASVKNILASRGYFLGARPTDIVRKIEESKVPKEPSSYISEPTLYTPKQQPVLKMPQEEPPKMMELKNPDYDSDNDKEQAGEFDTLSTLFQQHELNKPLEQTQKVTLYYVNPETEERYILNPFYNERDNRTKKFLPYSKKTRYRFKEKNIGLVEGEWDDSLIGQIRESGLDI